MRPVLIALAVVTFAPGAAFTAAPASATQSACRASTPQPGSLTRARILDSLRPHVEAMTGSDVEFVVQRISVACDWARVRATPRTPGGRGNRYEPVDALLQRRNGAWRLRVMACAEDGCPSAAVQYRQAYPGAPRSLLFD